MSVAQVDYQAAEAAVNIKNLFHSSLLLPLLTSQNIHSGVQLTGRELQTSVCRVQSKAPIPEPISTFDGIVTCL